MTATIRKVEDRDKGVERMHDVWVWVVDDVPVTFTNMIERVAVGPEDYIRDLHLRISHHRDEEFIQCTVRFSADYRPRPDGSIMMGRRFTGTFIDMVAVDILRKMDEMEGFTDD